MKRPSRLPDHDQPVGRHVRQDRAFLATLGLMSEVGTSCSGRDHIRTPKTHFVIVMGSGGYIACASCSLPGGAGMLSPPTPRLQGAPQMLPAIAYDRCGWWPC